MVGSTMPEFVGTGLPGTAPLGKLPSVGVIVGPTVTTVVGVFVALGVRSGLGVQVGVIVGVGVDTGLTGVAVAGTGVSVCGSVGNWVMVGGIGVLVGTAVVGRAAASAVRV